MSILQLALQQRPFVSVEKSLSLPEALVYRSLSFVVASTLFTPLLTLIRYLLCRSFSSLHRIPLYPSYTLFLYYHFNSASPVIVVVQQQQRCCFRDYIHYFTYYYQRQLQLLEFNINIQSLLGSQRLLCLCNLMSSYNYNYNKQCTPAPISHHKI